MNIPADLLPALYLWAGNALFGLLLCIVVLRAPWRKLRDSESLHVFLGGMVSVTLLWNLRGGIQPGLDYHLLAVTTLYLMFDWQFALLAVSLVLLFTTAFGNAGWEAFGINALLTGAVPVLATRGLLLAARLFLPLNFFVYIFVNAFLAAALSMLLAVLASAAIQATAGVHSGTELIDNFVLILPMLMFGEAFLNGAALSLVVAYRPQWVATFHDKWYLLGK